MVFANRNVAKRFLEKWQSAIEILQRDRLELFFTSWREQTRKGLITRADREIQIENFIEKRTVTMKAKVFSALYWHRKWRQDRKKVLEISVKPIARDSLYFAMKRWKIKVYNKKLLFRVFTNCERAWDEKRNEPIRCGKHPNETRRFTRLAEKRQRGKKNARRVRPSHAVPRRVSQTQRIPRLEIENLFIQARRARKRSRT